MTATPGVPPAPIGHRPEVTPPTGPDPGAFVDRVMIAVARAPRPSPTRALLGALVNLQFGDASAALGTAWRLAFERARPVMPLVRLQSLLLVMLLAALLGAGGVLAAGGAVRVFEELGRIGPGDSRPVVTGPSPGSSLAPGGKGAIELPSGDDSASPGDGGGQRGERERRQQDGTRTRSSEEGSDAAAPSPRRLEGDRKANDGQQGGVRPDDGEQGHPPRDGSREQGPGTPRWTPAPEPRQPQPTRAPGPGSIQAEPSPRDGGRTKGGS